MTQYVFQVIDATQRLIKCYTVTEKDPIRTKIPEGRTQYITTNTKDYDDAVAIYNEYTTKAKYTWNGSKLIWDIPFTSN